MARRRINIFSLGFWEVIGRFVRVSSGIHQDFVRGTLTQWEPSDNIEGVQFRNRSETAPVNPLNLFGLFAVTAMLIFYAFEKRSPWFILAFAASCILAAAYGFLQGAWPFGMVESVWSIVALRKWWKTRPAGPTAVRH
jgi:hypothetical protein